MRQKGFSLIELLVAVLIIGVLAAMAIGNYYGAMQRARQKRTMADIRAVAVAWESRAVDTKAYNAAAAGYSMPAAPMTFAAVRDMLVPTYVARIPRVDGWSNPLDFATDQPQGATTAAATYAIRSPGRDGSYTTGGYTPGPTTNFDCDIVYAGGQFIVWPEGEVVKRSAAGVGVQASAVRHTILTINRDTSR